MSDQTPAQLADNAAEAVRAFNHASRSSGEDWQYPGDAYSAVGNLAYLAGGLPQALAQIRGLMERLDGQGHLRSDKDTIGSDLHETYSGLDDARSAAEALYSALNRAHSGLSPIAYQE